MEAAVELKQVVKQYGKKRVLDGATVSFQTGKLTGLLGENGAGKSTLFKLVMGLTQPTEGEVRVFGHKPSWKLNERIAYLGDRSRWYPQHTIREALRFAAAVFPRFDEKRAQEYIQLMELDAEAKVRSLSRGQEARLQLSLCVANRVDLILLDEPFAGVDLLSRERMVRLLIDLMLEKEGTMIISTHDIHEVEGLFDNVVFIKGGKCIGDQNVEELRADRSSIQDEYRRLFG
ncbi:ABC transporter ATP-binding protein [Paenactinomyces guangxiensis]|uniref:ABC transporter ATP-binding protein n=1 Tax=Paenactinomyces guangxiensis TaxID=1490290 RepID=A0A7W1WQ64_9BACL|nr:ABC transporter ATP-binding protein [Paenactinomyces guangxiensis]MBA4493889.1 ABC transporter ATP-binding protein [Paenactinomyces guangxiensis]MBH8591355.1 ABC transporter ATP-binding protein [Paenactinomyces guangxiensis]